MPRRQHAVEAMARLVHSADFERLLRSPSRARTAHFAAHHVLASVVASSTPVPSASAGELSTIGGLSGERPVEDSLEQAPVRRLGVVVPKRHARRSVTRSLLKRQIRAAADRHGRALSNGLWMIRLRAPFDRSTFVSAGSLALRQAARAELDALFEAAAGRGRP